MSQRESENSMTDMQNKPPVASRRRLLQAAGVALPAVITLRSGGLAAQSICDPNLTGGQNAAGTMCFSLTNANEGEVPSTPTPPEFNFNGDPFVDGGFTWDSNTGTYHNPDDNLFYDPFSEAYVDPFGQK